MLTKQILYDLGWVEHSDSSKGHLNTIYFLNEYVLDVIPEPTLNSKEYIIRLSRKEDYNNAFYKELFTDKDTLEYTMKQLNII